MPSIINCPNCNFEQPQDEDYCPNCGGNMRSLLKAQKLKKKKETFKAKILIAGLFSTLLVGYIFIFFLKTPQKELSLADKAITSENKLKLKPSKIISRASSPRPDQIKSEEEIELIEKKALKADTLARKKSTALNQPKTDEQQVKDPIVTKEIQGINLIDQFNCEEQQTNIQLNERESDDLISCSGVILSDIALNEDIVLEEGDALITLKLILTKDSLKMSLSALVEEKSLIYDYTFDLPKTKDSTESLAFSIDIKPVPEDLNEILPNSEILNLFFRNITSENPEKLSTLLILANF